MHHARIGELLSRMAHLTGHDVEEILEEQTLSRRRFGDIALSWGLCQPEHVWTAWYSQLGDGAMRVDLDETGIDAQAVVQVPQDVATQLNAIPVRWFADQLVVAVPDDAAPAAVDEIRRRLGANVRFVRADRAQILAAIQTYYGELKASA